MNKSLILTALFFFSLCVNAQENYTQEEDKVTHYEMSMKEYEADPEAEALVIYDLGEYYFQRDDNRGFLLCMKKHIKIKILKQSGIDFANFEIPYYSENREWESIENIKGTTYNFDGKLSRTPLSNKNIFEEKINENTYIKKIAFPNVREGSIVEFSYSIVTPFYFNMRKWEFQHKIPVVYSRLIYKAIPYYAYTYIVRGATKFDEFSSEVLPHDIIFGNLKYREMAYHFGMKNIPAFRDEEFITSKENHLMSMNFQMSQIFYPRGGSKQIMTTWPQMCDDFLKDDDFGKYVKSSEKEAKKILPTLRLEGKSQEEQIEIITDYVKLTYDWNGRYSKFSELKLKDFLTQKTGNTGNINLFLTGLLKAAGIEADPVILSTRKNGEISTSHPFQQFFNYVIVLAKTEKRSFLLDGTEPFLHFSDLPERCINVTGLVILPKTEKWITTQQKMHSSTQKSFTIKLDPEKNKADIEATYTQLGDAAYKMRSIYQGKEENLTKYLKEKNNIECRNIRTAERPSDKPFAFSFEFNSSIENNGGKLFIQPFCNLNISSNPFKQTSRTLPVDLIYYYSDLYMSTIHIPEGYKVEYLPKNLKEDNALMTIDYHVNVSDNTINITASYSLKKNLYEASQYNSLKIGHNTIIKQFSEMIVLAKKE